MEMRKQGTLFIPVSLNDKKEVRMRVTQCKGEGHGSCKMCSDNGIWNIYWMCFLYKIEGYEGCYCFDCVEKIRQMNINDKGGEKR